MIPAGSDCPCHASEPVRRQPGHRIAAGAPKPRHRDHERQRAQANRDDAAPEGRPLRRRAHHPASHEDRVLAATDDGGIQGRADRVIHPRRASADAVPRTSLPPRDGPAPEDRSARRPERRPGARRIRSRCAVRQVRGRGGCTPPDPLRPAEGDRAGDGRLVRRLQVPGSVAPAARPPRHVWISRRVRPFSVCQQRPPRPPRAVRRVRARSGVGSRVRRRRSSTFSTSLPHGGVCSPRCPSSSCRRFRRSDLGSAHGGRDDVPRGRCTSYTGCEVAPGWRHRSRSSRR